MNYNYSEREKQLYKDIKQHPTNELAWIILFVGGLAAIAIVLVDYIGKIILYKEVDLTVHLICASVGIMMLLIGFYKNKELKKELGKASLKRYGTEDFYNS